MKKYSYNKDMNKTTFTLNNYQFVTFFNKAKLFATLSSLLTKAYFKLEEGLFHFYLKGSQGIIHTKVSSSYSGTPIYFSIDYSKWVTALQKLESCDQMKITLTNSLFTIQASNTADVINLGISYYSSTSAEAQEMNDKINQESAELKTENRELILNDDLLEALSLADSLFVAQGKANSVGLFKNSVVYSDRNVVLRTQLTEELSDNLFKDAKDVCIYLHSFVIKLLPLLNKFSSSIFFSEYYDEIYWCDADTELIFISGNRQVALPDEEDWQAIKPSNEDSFIEMNLDELKEGLSFFTGFYTGTAWKPLTFTVIPNKETILSYRHPTAEIKKAFSNINSPYAGSFILDSDTLGKIVTKVLMKYGDKDTPTMIMNYDEDAPGVYCNINNGEYEIVLSKLQESED